MYIKQSACISPQRTFDNAFLEGNVATYKGIRYQAIEPEYNDLIPAGLLRRMGKAIRMGVGAGLPLIRETPVDGIILGTANGGLEDCLKFLNQIVDYNEGTLTPTNFVQSTPNAVAGNLALMSKITGYNTTHVHNGLAFEAALLDAWMLLQEGRAERLLVGTVEEISDYNHNIDSLGGSFKKGDFTSDELFTSNTPGSVNGEGAVMFVIEEKKSAESVARIVDVDQTSYLPESGLHDRIQSFLAKNGLTPEDIDSLFIGISGDSRTDYLYTSMREKLFSKSNCYSYKNFVGDYPTASAFATWLGVQMLAGKKLPDQCKYAFSEEKEPRNILIYNQFKGLQHGLILLGAS
ncbi:beta-ketoacyl synthase chain length factor [Dyadobacter crusticola]|uniref:beta-ketoacyl synthase chain length factor n=1 Tax=Dyadobacter crusticola TaxID=292407 RepID=UPI0004E1D71E|nr:beta-ketoacyl synthase chain length factor [Dyadobacter crusticola]